MENLVRNARTKYYGSMIDILYTTSNLSPDSINNFLLLISESSLKDEFQRVIAWGHHELLYNILKGGYKGCGTIDIEMFVASL
jgi:hypothetical protein